MKFSRAKALAVHPASLVVFLLLGIGVLALLLRASFRGLHFSHPYNHFPMEDGAQLLGAEDVLLMEITPMSFLAFSDSLGRYRCFRPL